MPLERIDSYFNGAVESYDERLKRSAEDEDGYIRRTGEFFPKKEHLHILDIGIGTGTGLTAILEQNPTIYVDGIDCADKMLSEIPKNLPEHKERIRTICGDFFKYELEPESYDGAVSMMALHYYSREENLELFHRVCRSIKKGGFFLLSDKFAPTQMYEDFCRSEFEQKRKEQHLSADEHYYCFTPQYVAGEAALLFKAGFAEVRVCWAKSNTAVLLATK